jgi:hypothetical protein
MTLTLHLSPELEQRLKQEAKRQGLSLDAYALQLLAQSLPPKDRQAELVTLLQSWIRLFQYLLVGVVPWSIL